MSEDNNFSRRKFVAGGSSLAAAALIPTPVERLLNTLTRGFIRRAYAEETGNGEARNYLNILIPGGPLRYGFDHWLRIRDSDPVLSFNPMVSNSMISGGGKVVGVANQFFRYNNVLTPFMFGQNVFNGKGTQRPLANLLDNMLVIRGFASGFDGHPFNATLQQAPVGGVPSIAGLAADSSTKTFEAVQWPDRGQWGTFASSKGKALNKIGGSPLKALMEGFGAPAAGLGAGRNLKERNREAFDLAQSRLNAFIKTDFTGASSLSKNFSNAVSLMKKGTGNIDAYWNPAVARYKSVIENSMRQMGLVGVNDVALVSDQSALWKMFLADGSTITSSPDFDMRQTMASAAAPPSLAEGLALAEYVFKEQLVSSLEIQVGSPTGLLVQGLGMPGPIYTSITTDMHETGAIPATLIMNAYYRGLAAGMLELIDQLKATNIKGKNLWSETVIQVLSEFERAARSDGSGSDHGYNQLITSVYSGAIQNGPYIVGNISRGGLGGAYEGTQGLAAAIEGYNQNGRPSPAMAASTVAAILRVAKNPFENIAAPLVEIKNGQLHVLKDAKIVG
jgi:hypothetical protein